MRLILHNIGMLEQAEIDIKNLSVLAGENDNGKSTVGKIMFCLIKAIARHKEDLEESKEFRFRDELEQFYFTLRRARSIADYAELIPAQQMRELLERPDLTEAARLETAYHFIQIIRNNAVHLETEEVELIRRLQKNFDKLQAILEEPEDLKRSIENALKKVFASEFDASVLLNGAKQGDIKLYEANFQLLHIQITSQHDLELVGPVELMELKDATFIESPLILNNHDLLLRSQTSLGASKNRSFRLGLPYTTLHTKDLFDKLVASPLISLHTEKLTDENKITQRLNSLLNGEVVYDISKKDFFFNKENNAVSIKNTASGIKVFGLIKILIDNGFINTRSLLIFDEPENHLHPKWQLVFAETIVELIRIGVRVMLSTHSPYMVEALKRYSERAQLSKKTAFYLAENKTIQNKDRLGDIFTALAEPFEVFQKMDRETLKDE